MKAFITGVGGFAGSHLADLLLANGDEVAGSILAEDRLLNLAHLLGPPPRLRLFRLDILDRAAVAGALAEVRPEVVFHLAGSANVSASWEDPENTLRVNMMGTEAVLAAAALLAPLPRVVFASSSEVYGRVPATAQPAGEGLAPAPASPYAASKAAAEMLCLGAWHGGRLPVVIARPFNHLGPRQAAEFAVPAFARQLAAIAAGQAEPIVRVGNLTAERDFTDVRDTVAAYVALAERGWPGEAYNVASGKMWRMAELLEALIALSGLTVRVEADPARFRPIDIPSLVGDAGKLVAATGWRPQFALRETLKEVWEHWSRPTPVRSC